MQKLPMFALAAAAVISVPASAGERISIQTEVTMGGVVVSNATQEISKGGTAHFNDGRFKEIDANVTVTCREGISRWLNPFKPACDEPIREKEMLPVGFMADISAREASGDKFVVSVDGKYVQVLEEQKLKHGETELESASFRTQSLNSSMVVMANSELEIANGAGADEIKLKVKVQRL
ncbi:hypothetical protein ACIUYZ_00995 [Pseudomonas aeruginosa]